jgi:hypothetical protein
MTKIFFTLLIIAGVFCLLAFARFLLWLAELWYEDLERGGWK